MIEPAGRFVAMSVTVRYWTGPELVFDAYAAAVFPNEPLFFGPLQFPPPLSVSQVMVTSLRPEPDVGVKLPIHLSDAES